MQDKQAVNCAPEFAWNRRHELLFNGLWIVRFCPAQSKRDPAYVRIDSDGRNVEGLVQNDACRFSSNARQRDEVVDVAWHDAAETVDERARRGANPFCLLPEEAGRAHDGLELREGRFGEPLRRGIGGEERWRDLVDPLVGRLCREDHRDEQLEGVPIVQLRLERPVAIEQGLHDEADRRFRGRDERRGS